jgi:hypothetical protein
MNTQRPSQRELDEMTEAELFEGLLNDPGWAAQYRTAIRKFRSKVSFDNNHKNESFVKEPPKSLDIMGLIRSSIGRVKMEEDQVYAENPGLGSLRPLAEAILNSGWDFVDPDPRGMHPDPIGNRAFVEDFAYRDKYWDDLVARGQRKWNTIIDAYNRWLRQSKR